MPEVDGIEAVATLKAEKSATKFIAISGGPLRSEGDRLPEALELGAGYTFGKPIDNKELLEASETLLGA
ncbi:MAG: response regulator, partial [Gemmatimonadetes bacterium]|nr:response regulator [Gemmatimonadota bacterium]